MSDDPRGGRFYCVQFRDRPADVVRHTLASCGIEHPTAAQIDAYMHLLGGGRYNPSLYGSRSTSIAFPSRWMVPGLGVGIRCAWLPRNQDALDAYIRGRTPKRTIDEKTGAAMTPHTAWGMLWLCPVELVDGELTTSMTEWSDGSSTLDPPAPFLTGMETE